MKVGDLLFVYGTLRRGERADLGREEIRCTFLGEDHINGKIYNVGTFPGLIAEAMHFDPGKPFVTGDVFRLRDESIISQLDHYEGYPHLYNRIETETAKGLHVWAYTYNHDVTEERLILSGDWKKPLVLQQPVTMQTEGFAG